MLRCADGTPYKSEKSFAMSTHICKHCGRHKEEHSERAVVSGVLPLAFVGLSDLFCCPS